MVRFRNDLNPALFEDIPSLDLAEDHDHDPDGLEFWGEDGGRLNRFVAGDEGDDEDDEDSSSDESEHFDDDDQDEDDDDDEMDKKKHSKKEFDLPGHV